MATKIYSLHIGVAYVDDKHYGKSIIPLPCCVKDAEMMHGVAKYFNYNKSHVLLNEHATVSNFKKTVESYSKELSQGDLCVITYSGHGSELPDLNGDEIIPIDQTWCLYDRQLIDDELPHLWKQFGDGVNVLVILDSCHSGTSIKNYGHKSINTLNYVEKFKAFDLNLKTATYTKNKKQYEKILEAKPIDENEVKCSVTLLAACQDNEEALAGSFVSFFTGILIKTLAQEGNEIQNYQDFHRRLTTCLLYTSPSPRDATLSRMPSSA